MAVSVLEKRVRQSLRNTWITEAIFEKLSREQDHPKQRISSNA